jgi:NAD+ synthase
MSTRGADIADWVRRQVAAAGARGVAVGLSGGVDSAVVARLCQMAAPGNVVGVILPCHSDTLDETDAFLVADHFAIPTIRIDLGPAYDHLLGYLKTAFAQLPPGQLPVPAPEASDIRARMPFANVKPRMRMSALYFVANSLGYLVAGTANRSDLTIGHFTKYGDGGVDLLPLGTLMKSEVRVLARALEVPESIIEKAPGAGLWPGQTDESEMGFTYADLENYLIDGPDLVAPALAMRIERLVRSSDHKRTLPPMPDDVSF